MKNTIEINGKLYRCRDNSIEPLHFYEYSNDLLHYCHDFVYRHEKEGVCVACLDRDFRANGEKKRSTSSK